MAEENIDLAGLQSLLKDFPLLTKVLDEFKTGALAATGTTEQLIQKIASACGGSAKFTTALQSLGLNTDSLIKGLVMGGLVAERFTTNMFGASRSMEGFSAQMKISSAGVGNFKEQIEKGLGNIPEKFASLSKALERVPLLGGLQKKFGASINEIVASISRVQNMEDAIISTYAATGKLNEIFSNSKVGDFGGQMDDLTGFVNSFNKEIVRASSATGINVEQMSQYAAKLGSIPGLMDRFGKSGEAGLDNIITATKIAAASGQTVDAVAEQLGFAFNNLNRTGESALTFAAEIASTASALGVAPEVASRAIEGTASKFDFLTNKTEGTVRALANFVPAMQAAGLSSTQAITMFAQATDSIKSMDVASKAFLSSRSGGPGGLQGAFRIDKLIKDGNMDEVMKMMEANLKRQFGGRIVSLDQASTNQADAAQLQKQLAFIKNSAFGKLADTDDKAFKIFESMQKGGFSSLGKSAPTGSDALKLETVRGESRQKDRASGPLTEIGANVAKIANMQDELISAFYKNNLGGRSDFALKLDQSKEQQTAINGRNSFLDDQSLKLKDDLMESMSNIFQTKKSPSDVEITPAAADKPKIKSPTIDPQTLVIPPPRLPVAMIALPTPAAQAAKVVPAQVTPSTIQGPLSSLSPAPDRKVTFEHYCPGCMQSTVLAEIQEKAAEKALAVLDQRGLQQTDLSYG